MVIPAEIAFQQHFYLNTKDRLLLHSFLLGALLYMFAFVLISTDKFSYGLGYMAQMAGVGLMLPSLFLLSRYEFDAPYLKVVFSAYLIWLIGVVVRGLTLDYDQLKFLLFDSWFGAFIYLAPLVLLLPRNMFVYRRMFDLIVICCLLYLALDVLFLPELLASHEYVRGSEPIGKYIVETFSKTLAIPAGFILLTYAYHSKKVNLLALITLVVAIVFGIIRARRGLIFMASLPLFVAFLLYLYNSHLRLKGLLIFLTLSGGLFLNTVAVSVFNQGNLFMELQKRMLQDTRSGVEVRFFEDLTLTDWFIGKGMNGKYYCPEVPSPHDVRGFREVIETDFLQIILKGGLISLVLLMLILIPAAFRGIFLSTNLLGKAAGIWILLAVINMYPSTVNAFTPNYLLVWLCVGICFSKTIRNMPDESLRLYFRS